MDRLEFRVFLLDNFSLDFFLDDLDGKDVDMWPTGIFSWEVFMLSHLMAGIDRFPFIREKKLVGILVVVNFMLSDNKQLDVIVYIPMMYPQYLLI